MRKFLALGLVAVLSLTMVLAVVGCGGNTAEQPAQTESAPAETPMAETPMPAEGDTSAAMSDTSMSH